MRKLFILFFISASLVSVVHGQLMVSKLVGKNSANANLGWGVFTYFDFPLSNENTSFRIELLDFAYFPTKDADIPSTLGYLSIKLGYKYVFSETQTGVYVEPQAGYCRVVMSEDPVGSDKIYGDGFALALETGYSLEVGQNGNTLNFGLKYESDLAGSYYTANSIGFRVSFSFHIFRKKDN
jgi:hypothetical protein